MGKLKEKKFRALISNIPVVTDYVNEELERVGVSMKTEMQIDVAVDEIFTNIASYSYRPETGDAVVRVQILEDPLRLEVTFIDQGIPFNPLLRKDPDTTLSLEQRQIGGLGIFLVKKSMDEVLYEYKDGSNILTIRKNLS